MLKVNKAKCTGCSACVSICPLNCITMQSDEYGFLYPTISNKCIGCGKCDNICPLENKKKEESFYKQEAYCLLSKSEKVWKRSSSGGAFTEICKAFGDDNTIIIGAGWNGFKVEHIAIKGINNILPICKSKYIASNMKNNFITIRERLNRGEKVIFCGTPCQVAGLKNMLGKKYENLLLIDLICHGVGSPKVFEDCIKVTEQDLGANIYDYEFRAKRDMYETPYLVRVSTNSKKNKNQYITNDRYMQLFLSQHCLRESCGKNCGYRTSIRQGDLTIADCKGLLEIFPELIGTKYNYSTVVVNSEKGANVLNLMKASVHIKQYDVNLVKKYNPLFYKQTIFSESREHFFNDYSKDSKQAIIKYTTPPLRNNGLSKKLSSLMPTWFRKFFIKLIKR